METVHNFIQDRTVKYLGQVSQSLRFQVMVGNGYKLQGTSTWFSGSCYSRQHKISY